MATTVTERKVDHAAAEMLEEPFIRVRILFLICRKTPTTHVSFPIF